MKNDLSPGIQTTRRITADAERCIAFMGDDLSVYATPAVVADMENTCRDLLLEHIDAGEDSVGTRVVIDHMAPTLMGMWADITVTIAAVEGRLVTFDFTVADEVETVAKGTHIRFVVNKEKTAERLAAKREKAKG